MKRTSARKVCVIFLSPFFCLQWCLCRSNCDGPVQRLEKSVLFLSWDGCCQPPRTDPYLSSEADGISRFSRLEFWNLGNIENGRF